MQSIIPIRIGERGLGKQTGNGRMGAHDRRPLGAPEAARVDRSRAPRPLEAPSSDQSRSRRPLEGLEGPTWDDFGPIRGRSGGGEVPGTSAGPSRGALFANLTFFASEADLGSILPLPRSLWRALWPPLGALWAALVALGTPLWAPKGVLGAAWGPSWSAFLRSWAKLGPPMAPGTFWGAILDRFGLDFGALWGGFSFGCSNESSFELAFAKAGNFAIDSACQQAQCFERCLCD